MEIHDLYILYIAEIIKAHRDALEASFGKDWIELRRKFSIHLDYKKHYVES